MSDCILVPKFLAGISSAIVFIISIVLIYVTMKFYYDRDFAPFVTIGCACITIISGFFAVFILLQYLPCIQLIE